MLRKLTALSVLALSLFAAKAAHAEDWYMVSAYDFVPQNDNKIVVSTRGAYVTSSTGWTHIRAVVRIPHNKTFNGLYCQITDTSAAKDVKVTLMEQRSTDDGSVFYIRDIMSVTSSGSPFHTKLWTATVTGPGSAYTNAWTCNGTCTYYSYYVDAYVPDTSNTAVKACAISYI